MTNQTTKTILAELDDACTQAWAETINGLTPEEQAIAKKITLRQWITAIVEVGLDIGNEIAQMLRKN
jgi:hypothetical protein